MSNNMQSTTGRNEDVDSGREPQRKVPRLAENASTSSPTPTHIISNPYEGQSTLESGALCLNLPNVLPPELALQLDTSLDCISPTIDDGRDFIALTVNHGSDNFHEENDSNSSPPPNASDMLQNYLWDPQCFHKLRAFITKELALRRGRNEVNNESMEALEDLIRMLKYEDHNSIYRLLASSLLGPLEKAEAVEDDVQNLFHLDTNFNGSNVHDEAEPPESVATQPEILDGSNNLMSTGSQIGISTIATTQAPQNEFQTLGSNGPRDQEQTVQVVSSSSNVPQSQAPPISTSSESTSDTSEVDMDSLYRKLIPVMKKAETAMSRKGMNWRKKITKFGKLALLTLFDSDELLNQCASGRVVNGQTTEEFNDDKVSAIARFLGFLISKPDNFSIEEMKIYITNLSNKKRGSGGLRSKKYEYFKERVLQKVASDERRKLRKATQNGGVGGTSQ